jgi:hypothetical protein
VIGQFWAIANATAKGEKGEVLEIVDIKETNLKVRRCSLLSNDYRRPHTFDALSWYPQTTDRVDHQPPEQSRTMSISSIAAAGKPTKSMEETNGTVSMEW